MHMYARVCMYTCVCVRVCVCVFVCVYRVRPVSFPRVDFKTCRMCDARISLQHVACAKKKTVSHNIGALIRIVNRVLVPNII